MHSEDTDEVAVSSNDVAAKIARETLSGDIRDLILSDAKDVKSSLPWHLRPEAEQREVIERVNTLAQSIVDRAVKIISADGRPTIIATIKKAGSNGEHIEAVVRINKSDPLRHALMDAVGDTVLLVVAASDIYTGEKKPVYATPDQSGMFDGDDDEPPVFDNTPHGKE